MNQIKIYDVAGAAGVSLATVSRVLNHPEKVKPATRAKIEKIIKDLGYKPNLNAKGLASSRSTTVAVVIPRLDRSSIAEMVNGIADCADRRGYMLRLFVNKSQANDESSLEVEKETWGNVIASGVDGVLYVNDEITDEYLNLINSMNVPVVLTNTDRGKSAIPCVTIDYKKAAADITKQMIDRGNKKIWLITTQRKYVVNDLKIEGYTNAMKDAGLEPRIISVSGKTRYNEPEFEKILKVEHPDVAIVVRDSMAVSFLNVARNLEIDVPGELQIIGFQNTRYAVLSRPKLTCIDTPIYELGEEAMDLLTELMENEGEENLNETSTNRFIDYSIVWRESTRQ